VSVTHLPGLVSLHLITHNGALDFTP
jgi:hypothetical protein